LHRRLRRILFLIGLRLRVMRRARAEQGSAGNRIKRRTRALDASCILAAAVGKCWVAGRSGRKPDGKGIEDNLTHAMSVNSLRLLILIASRLHFYAGEMNRN
jgi:hypothetical protein